MEAVEPTRHDWIAHAVHSAQNITCYILNAVRHSLAPVCGLEWIQGPACPDASREQTMQKTKFLMVLMLAVSALAPLAGHAQDRDQRWDRDRHDERVDRDRRGDHADMDRRGDRADRERRGDRADMDRRGDRAWAHRWNRGERIPPEYRDRQYVIDDWREHRLSPPPRGYHWVGVDGGYYLVRPDGLVFNVTIGN